MMTTLPLITSNDRKGIQFLALCAAAYNKAGLNAKRAQHLNEQGGVFQAQLQKLISEFTTTLPEPPVWLPGYMYRPIAQQVAQLQELFPGIGGADASRASAPLPEGAESYFAIPLWQKIAPTYSEALERVLAMIKYTRGGKFCNLREGTLDSRRLRQESKTKLAFETLAAQQRGRDILVVSAQLGDAHKGKCVYQVREELANDEFGFDAFAVGIILLTHPERPQSHDALFLDCPGSGYCFEEDGLFLDALDFNFKKDGTTVFSSFEVEGGTNEYYGSVTGFVPEK